MRPAPPSFSFSLSFLEIIRDRQIRPQIPRSNLAKKVFVFHFGFVFGFFGNEFGREAKKTGLGAGSATGAGALFIEPIK